MPIYQRRIKLAVDVQGERRTVERGGQMHPGVIRVGGVRNVHFQLHAAAVVKDGDKRTAVDLPERKPRRRTHKPGGGSKVRYPALAQNVLSGAGIGRVHPGLDREGRRDGHPRISPRPDHVLAHGATPHGGVRVVRRSSGNVGDRVGEVVVGGVEGLPPHAVLAVGSGSQRAQVGRIAGRWHNGLLQRPVGDGLRAQRHEGVGVVRFGGRPGYNGQNRSSGDEDGFWVFHGFIV